MKEESYNNEVAATRRLVIEREHSALLIWGITSASSGLFLDYSRLIQMAAVGLVLSIAVRVHEASDYELLWFASGIISLLVLPGLDMVKRIKINKL